MLLLAAQAAPVRHASAVAEVPDAIVTAAPAYQPLAALDGGERFPQGAQLLLIHAGKAEPLAKEFAASADANVSFDGKRVLFAAKKTASDPWQIWEMTLVDRAVRRVIGDASDAIRPFYLPSGQLIFARKTAAGFAVVRAGAEQSSYTAALDEQADQTEQVLTPIPASVIPDDVLRDGRILFESKFPLGEGKTAELFLMYSDGSGVESYRCDHGRARWGGHQLASGDVVFTHGASLGRFTSPLAHEVAVTAPRLEFAGGLAETASGAWLVSARASASAKFALKLWKPGAAAIETVYAQAGTELVEPAIVGERERPHHHPSSLHPWKHANLLALDARQSREGDLKTAPKTVRLETLDAKGKVQTNGTAPVESDGSFFVQIPGDRPVRFVLLDENGKPVRQQHGWFWSRSGEQRYCVGCHTGPERGAENQVPKTLLQSTTPVDLTGAKHAETNKTEAGSK
jgi:hypothetical protein